MDVYLLRHADAEDAAQAPGGRDAARRLTREGRDKMKSAVRGMKRMGLAFDAIYTSPLERARQTAEIVAESLALKTDVRVHEALLPNASYEEFESLVRAASPVRALLAVGHLPSLPEFFSELIGSGGEASVDFKKGALCRLYVLENSRIIRAELKWFLPNRVLRNIS